MPSACAGLLFGCITRRLSSVGLSIKKSTRPAWRLRTKIVLGYGRRLSPASQRPRLDCPISGAQNGPPPCWVGAYFNLHVTTGTLMAVRQLHPGEEQLSEG